MLTIRKGFTLIELLVVIAIIAILAAILFPVFAQAKVAAKKTADLSNVKQLGTAVAIYLNDSDDKYPELCTADFSGTGPAFPANLAMWSSVLVTGPYMKNTDLLFTPVDTRVAFSPTDYTWTGMPATRPQRQLSYMANAMTTFSWGSPYGVLNGQGLFVVDNVGWGGVSPVTDGTSVGNPTQVIMFSNGVYEYYGRYYGMPQGCLDTETDYCYAIKGVYSDFIPAAIRLAAPTDAIYNAWRKFSGRSNFNFADTHAKSLAPTQVDNAQSWLINAP